VSVIIIIVIIMAIFNDDKDIVHGHIIKANVEQCQVAIDTQI